MITNEMLVMKAQIKEAHHINGSISDEIAFDNACKAGDIQTAREVFRKMNPIVGYSSGPKPLNQIYGFRHIKVTY